MEEITLHVASLLVDLISHVEVIALDRALQQRVVSDDVWLNIDVFLHLLERDDSILQVSLLSETFDQGCVDDRVYLQIRILLHVLEHFECFVELTGTDASVHETSEGDFVHGNALFLHFIVELKWDCAVLEMAITSEHYTICNSPRLDIRLLHLLEQLISLR